MATTIGFTCGAFDLLHVGHLSMLKECAENCDYLIVGLQTNPAYDRNTKNTPVQSMFERYTMLEACTYVDKIIPYDTEYDLTQLLATQKIDIRFVGIEYSTTKIVGADICKKREIDIYYTAERLHDYSSSRMRERVWAAEQMLKEDI